MRGLNCKNAIVMLYICVSIVDSLRLSKFRLQMGYVSPENDPEYLTMVPKNLLAPELKLIVDDGKFDAANFLPVPKEGDIVQCPGEWKGELVLGKLRDIQIRNNTWIADILPLKEGKSARIYTIDKDSKILTVNLDEVAPVKAFFVRAENGYNISTKVINNITQISLRADGYREIESNYTFPKKNKVRHISHIIYTIYTIHDI